jgi:hypothetical protein
MLKKIAPRNVTIFFMLKLLDPANQVDPFYKVKTYISKIVAFRGQFLKI